MSSTEAPSGRSSSRISWTRFVFGRGLRGDSGSRFQNHRAGLGRSAGILVHAARLVGCLRLPDRVQRRTYRDRPRLSGRFFVFSLLADADCCSGVGSGVCGAAGDPWRPLRRAALFGLALAARSAVCFLAIDLSIASSPRRSRCLHHPKPGARARRGGGTGEGRRRGQQCLPEPGSRADNAPVVIFYSQCQPTAKLHHKPAETVVLRARLPGVAVDRTTSARESGLFQ
jgi:hypothetical protein